MKKALLILLVALLNMPVFAGTPGDQVMFVSGTVVDHQSNETLAGVEVRVKGTNMVTYTDFDGNFYLADLPVGTYELEFHYITYTATETVTDNCTHCPTLTVEMEQR